MDEFKNNIKEFNYLIINDDGISNMYSSLRSISNDINVDYSTISKKMKINNGEFCFCRSKLTKTNYYICKIKLPTTT